MRYCNNCGEKIADDAKFCPTCGTKFADQAQQQQQQTYQPPAPDKATITNKEQAPTQQPNYQQQAPTQQPPQQNYGQGYQQNYQQSYQQTPNNPYIHINNNFYQQSEADKPSGKLNAGMLVWSIINIVLCCSPLFGIIALIMTITANSTSTIQEEKRKLKTAKILNLIGTILGVLGVFFYILLYASGSLDIYGFQY